MNTDPQEAESRPLVSQIASHPFLMGLSLPHVEVLADSAMLKEFAPNELIFREGDPANRFYLIESGKVILETSKNEKTTTLIQTIGAGDVLGWSWLFPPYYWHFDARAAEATNEAMHAISRAADNVLKSPMTPEMNPVEEFFRQLPPRANH